MPIRRLDRPSLPGDSCALAVPRAPMSVASYILDSPFLDCRFGISSNPGPPALLRRNGKGVALGFLGATCGLLCDSCGFPELPRRGADDSLEVMGELALIREAGLRRDLRQGEVAVLLQEFPGPLDAAGDD